jgi:hypothetical protein
MYSILRYLRYTEYRIICQAGQTVKARMNRPRGDSYKRVFIYKAPVIDAQPLQA